MRLPLGRHGILSVGAGLSLALACSQPPPRPHVILLLVDTLRADHVGSYGYPRDTTPHLDAFASEAVLFLEARSQAPCTFPSVNSLLTSRHASYFHGRSHDPFGIPTDFVSLPEVLRAHGYRTVAVSASPIVRKTAAPHNREGGFDNGFDRFDEQCLWRDASCVNAEAFRELDAATRPLFLYLHYIDPHDPYRPPEGHTRRFARDGDHPQFVVDGDPNPVWHSLYARDGGDLELEDDELQHLVDLYDDEIRYFDEQFQLLLDGLSERGLRGESIVIVASDHGEAFLERSDIKHCRHLFDSQIKTPLMMEIPGIRGGRRVSIDVQNLDIAPTLLDLLGIPFEGFRFEGRSLRELVETGTQEGRPVFSSWKSLRSVVQNHYKLVLDLETGSVSLYDLGADPLETRDVAVEKPADVRRLLGLLENHLREVDPDRSESVKAGERTVELLRELGYIE